MSKRRWPIGSVNAQPDIKALVTLKATADGGRRTAAYSGYRPHHGVKENYLTSGIHNYLGNDVFLPGKFSLALITFLAPEHYPHCLWIGKVLTVQEGSRIVGCAEVVEIYNDLLDIARGGSSTK